MILLSSSLGRLQRYIDSYRVFLVLAISLADFILKPKRRDLTERDDGEVN